MRDKSKKKDKPAIGKYLRRLNPFRWRKRNRSIKEAKNESKDHQKRDVMDEAARSRGRDNLYQLIVASRWSEVVEICKTNPGLLKMNIKASRRSKASSNGTTFLHLVCSLNAPFEVTQAVLHASPNSIKKTDDYGRLPLHRALNTAFASSNTSVIQLLVEAYPDSVLLTDSSGATCLQLAERSGAQQSVIDVLSGSYKKDKDTVEVDKDDYSSQEKDVDAVNTFRDEHAGKNNESTNDINQTLIYDEKNISADDDQNSITGRSLSSAQDSVINCEDHSIASNMGDFQYFSSQDVPLSITNFTDRAYSSYENCDFQQAQKLIPIAISEAEDKNGFKTALFINDSGNMYCEMGDFAKAKACYFLALEDKTLPPRSKTGIIFNLGIALLRSKQYQHSIYSFERASNVYLKENISKDFFFAQICNMKGYAFLKMRRFEEALKSFNETGNLHKALGGDRCVLSHNIGIGDTYRAMGSMQLAFEAYLIAADSTDDKVKAYAKTCIGNICVRKREYKEAAKHYEAAIETNRHGYRTLFNLGTVYRKLSRFKEAMSIFDDLLLQKDSPSFKRKLSESQVAIQKAMVYISSGELQQLRIFYDNNFEYFDSKGDERTSNALMRVQRYLVG